MKHTIRIIAAAFLLSLAACAHQEQPPVTHSSGGKSVVPAKR